MAAQCLRLLIRFFCCFSITSAFPHLSSLQTSSTPIALPNFTWSPSQLVDVNGQHAYQDPSPGQARGPCPAQNALANHGYLNRSGYTNLIECVTANTLVFNMGADFATYLCFMGQMTGGDFTGLSWIIGNDSAWDNTITNSCTPPCLLGVICLPTLSCMLSALLDKVLGTPGFGMAQTHNSFEADSSVLFADWNTIYGLDASMVDMNAANLFFSKQLSDGTFDDLNIFIDWANYRMQYGISTNPCYFRAPQATLFAALGAYALVPRMFSNYTPEQPDGRLTSSVLASFYGLNVNSDGSLSSKGFGKNQIPANWYHRPLAYSIPEWLASDYTRFYGKYPALSRVGGNTNGVNTFTGVDVGNLTGGVINAQNLLDGDNFACFFYRVAQIDLEDKLPSAIGQALLSLGSTLGVVLTTIFSKMMKNPSGAAACPSFNYNNPNGQQQWCGVRSQPGGVYRAA